VVVAADGYLGQITGKVELPTHMIRPGLPSWAVWGDHAHRGNLISSIFQDWVELERHNEHLSAKYRTMAAREQRSKGYRTDGAETLVVACNTPARMAKAAVEQLRREGVPVGLFQPITLWPFPIDDLVPLATTAKRVLVVEASDGQLEDELRLAAHHRGLRGFDIHHLRHMGGVLPQASEVYALAREITEGLS
jgi:pyruvate/2-oxoacid:ferredoxin oxidoreductase alpha subunit